jgi:hypothetical protein
MTEDRIPVPPPLKKPKKPKQAKLFSNKPCWDPIKLKWENITIEMVKFWEECYPDVNVVDVLLKRMPPWLRANPEKAKKSKWERFIVNWLSREQSKYDSFIKGRRS